MIQQADDIDCLLVHVPKFKNYYKPFGEFMFVKYLPMGVLGIADYLDRHNYRCQIVHLGLERIHSDWSLAGYIKEKHVKLVGLPLYWHHQSYDTIEAARAVKAACPDVFVVLGGFTATSFSSEILGYFPFIDAVIEGDGEVPMLTLMEEIEAGRADLGRVPNLAWRRDGGVVRNPKSFRAGAGEMDRTSYSNFSLLKNNDRYRDNLAYGTGFSVRGMLQTLGRVIRGRLPFKRSSANVRAQRKSGTAMTPIAIGRGCMKICAWCAANASSQLEMFGRSGVVYRSSAAVIADIVQARKWGFDQIYMEPLQAPGFEENMVRLFRDIREAGITFDIYYEQSGLPTAEFIDEFARTFPGPGSMICLSRESYSDRLRQFNKEDYYPNNRLFQTLRHLDRKGIATELYLMLAGPPEKEADLPELKAFRSELLRRFKCVKSVLVRTKELEPHSLWFLSPEDYGIETDKKCFMDFYSHHKDPGSNPYSDMGYRIKDYFKDADKGRDVKSFEGEIQKIRCRHFCNLGSNTGSFLDPLTGRAKCNILNFLWRTKEILNRPSKVGST